MTQEQIIIAAIVAGVVLVLVIGAAVMIMRSRRHKSAEANRAKASHIRSEATADTRAVDVTALEASEARNRAERRRLEAQISETEAVEAERRHAVEEAQVEDQLRTADRIDPEVDHRAKDYRPTHADEPTATQDVSSDRTDATSTTAQTPVNDPR